MSAHYEITAISTGGPDLLKVASEQDVAVIDVEMTRKITPLKDLKALFRLVRIFRHTKPFMVHTHTPKAGLLGMLAARIANVPVRIHTVAGLPLLEARGMKRVLLNNVERLTYRYAQKVYPNSFNLKDIIISEKLCPQGKLKVIGNGSSNGIDVSYFSPEKYTASDRSQTRKDWKWDESHLVLCFVGRMVSDKGINELVQSFATLYKTYPFLRLLLVGPMEEELDPLLPQTTMLIKQHEGIQWLGYQSDVRPALLASDLFVFPSYREGFPNVVMQAGAMGLPCIVSDINGCNEIIEQGKNGLIVAPKDTAALQAAIETLVTDKEKRMSMAAASRENIVAKYDRNYLWSALLDEYTLLEKTIQ